MYMYAGESSFSTEDKDEEEETQQRTVKEEEYDHPWTTHNATQNLKETS